MIELIDREATVKQICKMGEMLGVGHDRDVTIAIALFVQDDKSAFPTISGWIEITTRPVTDEEREDFDDDVTYVFTCKLPDDGEPVLITTCRGDVCTDYFIRDGNICYFEDHQDVDEIIAWMPLPTPYMKEGEVDAKDPGNR